MSASTVYRMRSKALRDIYGGHDISYAQLPDYCEMVRSTNPGSFAFCAWTPQDHIDRPLQFLNIFISFKGCKDGLLAGCRSFIGVDGAHLKGNYGGVLLSAVALDANNELFPFAWAIVSVEDTENWKFFLWHLKNLLKDSGRGDEWCIISDRQKGIDAALTELWPKAGRRYCCKHLVKNWKKPFPGPLMFSLFWMACGAYSEFTFKKAMEQLQKEASSANWVDDDICPNIKARLKVITQESRCCKAYPSADGYEVTDGKSVLPISFADKRCLCGVWQIFGIPCRHGMRAILRARIDPKHFVHEWYYVRRYKAAYAGGINSIPDNDQWPDFDMPKIEPPAMKRGVGRPCRERRRDEDEERKGKRSKTIKCSNCQCFGHNSATCKGGPTAKQVVAASASTKGKGKQADVAPASASAKDKGKRPMS
ncbi:uncharacterized protein LOC110701949 [Chenopodium quinoa]|uniref:uncharacterized protein LOC110701949 n=1 Tax=Chenopodium quinoa TaxID=63459 RepID=UPI000B77AF72|nr:uncharacterized protein LOC110701949 [Chenopodium quinoa]